MPQQVDWTHGTEAGAHRRWLLALGLAATATAATSGASARSARPPAQEGGGPRLGLPAGLIALPRGFHYRVVADESTLYTDGTPRPGDADGMGAFPGPNNTTILCVNHELSDGEEPVVPPVAGHYDPRSSGGTSIMQVNPDRKLQQAWISSSGTSRNCAGAVTPWGTWISVEESLSEDGISHGWAFEVDPYAPLEGGTPRQIRLDPLGRFLKEGAAVDPNTRAVYQTEDHTRGLFYRFLPEVGTLPSGYGDYASAPGILQALVLPELPNANAADPGDVYFPQWAVVPDPEGSPIATRNQTYFDEQGLEVDPTLFYRGEGAAWSDLENALYFDCTGGGSSGHRGQIWRYEPSVNELTLVYESTSAALLDMPDNLFVLPWGDLVICEDGGGADHLRILSPAGDLIDFARTDVSELAGACWSSSNDTLYVNLQSPSITLAIWGPWERFGQPPK